MECECAYVESSWSTLLDPCYSVLLNNSQLEPIKTRLLQFLKDANGGSSSPSTISSAVRSSTDDVQPPERSTSVIFLEGKLTEGAKKASKKTSWQSRTTAVSAS